MDFAGKTHIKPVSGASSRARWGWIAGLALAMALIGCAIAAWNVLAAPRENPDEVWKQAETAFLSNQRDEAERGLARLARLRTPIAPDLMLRAQLAMARNQTDSAIADLSAIADGENLAPQARMLCGQLELRRRRMRPAEAYLRRAIALDPELIPARKELIYLYGMQIRRVDLAEQFLALSKRISMPFDMVRLWCLTRGSIWEPMSHQKDLQAFLDADPGDQKTRLAMAEMLQQQGLAAEAEATLKPLPADSPDVLALRARIAFDVGDVDTARALLARSPADHPGLARLRGRLDLLRRDPKAAIADFEVAERLDPGQRDTLYGLGHAYHLLGDETRAAPYLKAAAALDRLTSLLAGAVTPAARADPTLPRRLANACLDASRIPEARAWLKLILDRDPLDESVQRELFRLEHEEKSGPTPP